METNDYEDDVVTAANDVIYVDGFDGSGGSGTSGNPYHSLKNVLNSSAEDLTMGYKDGSSYKVNVFDANGNAVTNIKVKFTVKGKDYNIKTDSNGVAELPINLKVGNYTITATVNDANYESNNISNSIVVTADNLAIVANDVNMTYKDGTAYEVQLVDGQGNPVALAGRIIKVTVNGMSYDRKPMLMVLQDYQSIWQQETMSLKQNTTALK